MWFCSLNVNFVWELIFCVDERGGWKCVSVYVVFFFDDVRWFFFEDVSIR